MDANIETPENHSEELQEFIAKTPTWLVTRGNILFAMILASILFVSWFIHYPDIVICDLILSSTYTPKVVPTRNGGKLVKLFVNEDSLVKAGSILAYMESSANHDEVIELSNQLSAIINTFEVNPSSRKDFNVYKFKHLGEIQNEFQNFAREYSLINYYNNSDLFNKKTHLLKQELAKLIEIDKILKNQLSLQQSDTKLAQLEYNVQKELMKNKVLAPIEFDRESSKLIAKKMPIQQLLTSIANNEIQQNLKQNEILDIQKQSLEQRNSFAQTMSLLENNINAWKSQHIMYAPVDGKVHFASNLQEGQYFQNNKDLFYILPKNIKYFGVVKISQTKSGVVKVGQNVNIKFSAFPFQEYGIVKGQINRIEEVPTEDNSYVAKIYFPNGLNTSLNKRIPFKTGGAASAEIITKDYRLLEKIFYNFRSNFGN